MIPRVTLREPGNLTGFPSTPPPRRLMRICSSANRTWWFSSDGSGRFDLEPPDGTCYFAVDEYAAVREATRLGPVTHEWVGAREIRVIETDGNTRLAAITRKAAGGYGVTGELVTLVPYDLPREWAAAFRSRGFDGIRHPLRHDNRARPSGVSLFGPAGAATRHDGARIPLVVDLVEAMGVQVIQRPHSSVLTVTR